MRVLFVFDEDDSDDKRRSLKHRRGPKIQQQIDVNDHQTVGEVKELVRRTLRLPTDEISASSEFHERHVLALSLAGATLEEQWLAVDVGVRSGVTVRVHFRLEKRPSFVLKRRIDNSLTPIYQPINFRTATGSDLRAIVSRSSGLPVGSFRLVTSTSSMNIFRDKVSVVADDEERQINDSQSVTEIFDCQTLDKYGLDLGCTITMETWDGWNELLLAAFGGLSNQVKLGHEMKVWCISHQGDDNSCYLLPPLLIFNYGRN